MQDNTFEEYNGPNIADYEDAQNYIKSVRREKYLAEMEASGFEPFTPEWWKLKNKIIRRYKHGGGHDTFATERDELSRNNCSGGEDYVLGYDHYE